MKRRWEIIKCNIAIGFYTAIMMAVVVLAALVCIVPALIVITAIFRPDILAHIAQSWWHLAQQGLK